MNIRRAIRSDVPAILSIAKANPATSQWPEAEYVQALENIAARRVVMVAQAETEVIGFVVARTLEHEWELENIAVLPERQRKGVGQALMRVLLDVAHHHGAEAIFLEVRQSNSHARILYERCGFQRSGERKQYYSNPPEDAVLYRYLCNSELLENR
jgi:ribosomal-protein-alanine N-acetyltransferase